LSRQWAVLDQARSWRAVGDSGVTAQQDGQMAKAGVDALPKILGQ
jgi:uncharacterized protein GlcG (DUF336 family)